MNADMIWGLLSQHRIHHHQQNINGERVGAFRHTSCRGCGWRGTYQDKAGWELHVAEVIADGLERTRPPDRYLVGHDEAGAALGPQVAAALSGPWSSAVAEDQGRSMMNRIEDWILTAEEHAEVERVFGWVAAEPEPLRQMILLIEDMIKKRLDQDKAARQ